MSVMLSWVVDAGVVVWKLVVSSRHSQRVANDEQCPSIFLVCRHKEMGKMFGMETKLREGWKRQRCIRVWFRQFADSNLAQSPER